MAMSGYDDELVRSTVNNESQAYEQLMAAMGDQMQNTFVEGLADKWACPQAQRFFNENFKPALDEFLTSTSSTFENIAQTINSAGQNWASTVEASFSPVSFSTIGKTMDTSSIRENIGGVRGIDLDAANAVAQQLTAIRDAADSAVDAARQGVANSGFLGGEQQANISTSLNTISNKINEVVTNITNQSREAINQTVETYADTQGRIEQAFTLEG